MGITDQITKIKRDLPVDELIQHYTQLEQKGKNLVGKCPFCMASNGFNVSKSKNIFKCFSCGKGGDPINFILKYENMPFKEAVEFISVKFCNTLGFPENFTANSLRGDIYVLSLEDSCYYIGFTQNFELRMKHHFEGNGAIWTKKHPPLDVIERHPKKTLNYENFLTEKYISKYGYEKVRGGDHIYFQKKYGI